MKRKRAISIPPPRWKQTLSSKALRKDGSARKSAFNAKGAVPGTKKTAVRLAGIGESQRQANEIAQQQRLRKEYTKFFRTEDGRKFAREFGKSISPHGARNRNGAADVVDFRDPADLPSASVTDHPVAHIEPEGRDASSRALEGIGFDEIRDVTETFEQSIRWAIDGDDLVQKGLRSAIVIAALRPDLRFGLKIDNALETSFRKNLNSHWPTAGPTGDLFGAVLEWLRRGDDIAELGERIMVLFYVLRPDLIGANTLAALGKISNKTRQAKDKLANCLRDTFAGIQARAMRGDITRHRCRESHLTNPI